MRIRDVALTVTGLEEAARFYAEVLELPVVAGPGRVTVAIGSSRLVLTQGDEVAGVHHLAFGIAPADFALARAWLGRRVEPLVVDGSEVVVGPDGWDSESLYFVGPEDVVLELIARQADVGVPAGDGEVPRPLSISEIGISVPDVADAVRSLTGGLGLPTFPPQGTHFAPVGGHDGLVILVHEDRTWWPTDGLQASRGPVAVQLEAPRAGQVSLRASATVRGGD